MAQCRVKGHAVTLTRGSVQSSWPDPASCRSQKKEETLIVFLPFFMPNPGKREGNSGRHIILHARHCLFGGQCCQTQSPSDPARPCSQSRRRPSPATHHPQFSFVRSCSVPLQGEAPAPKLVQGWVLRGRIGVLGHL